MIRERLLVLTTSSIVDGNGIGVARRMEDCHESRRVEVGESGVQTERVAWDGDGNGMRVCEGALAVALRGSCKDCAARSERYPECIRFCPSVSSDFVAV